jgi:hypothetical protein
MLNETCERKCETLQNRLDKMKIDNDNLLTGKLFLICFPFCLIKIKLFDRFSIGRYQKDLANE